jgi:hypothetical protein
MTNLFYNALLKEAEAKKAEALAVLYTYMHKSVGIGEHPQMVEEATKFLDQLAAAEDRIATLRSVFTPEGNLLDTRVS